MNSNRMTGTSWGIPAAWGLAAAALVVCGLRSGTEAADAGPAESAFASTTIDLGTAVSDLKKSIAFYRDVVGFKELASFDVTPAMAEDSGLCAADRPFHVQIMVLGDEKTATKLKLFEFAPPKPEPNANTFVHSSLGFRYLTIFVKDIDAAVANAAKHGVKPLAKGPVAVPESIAKGIWLAVVKDPDGNFVEFVGPKVPK